MTRSMTRRTPTDVALRSAPRGSRPAAVAALALVLAACSSGTPDEEPAGEWGNGPLDAYFERVYGDMDQGAWDEQQRETEQLTAECMAEQGFEYVPVDWSSMNGGVVVGEDSEIEWGSREFAEQYGYGMSSWPGMDEQPLEEEEQVWEDPNQAYVESMSDTERDAYYIALYGEQTGPEDPEAEWEYDWTQAGCQGAAQQAVQEKYGLGGDQMGALQEDMEALWAQIQSDERVLALAGRWSDCMADAGYPGMASPDDPQQILSDEQNAIYEEVYGDGLMEDADWEALEAEVRERTAAMTEKEIAMAVADFDCKDAIDFQKVQIQVATEHQKAFVDTHRAELEAWVESVEAARS